MEPWSYVGATKREAKRTKRRGKARAPAGQWLLYARLARFCTAWFEGCARAGRQASIDRWEEKRVGEGRMVERQRGKARPASTAVNCWGQGRRRKDEKVAMEGRRDRQPPSSRFCLCWCHHTLPPSRMGCQRPLSTCSKSLPLCHVATFAPPMHALISLQPSRKTDTAMGCRIVLRSG